MRTISAAIFFISPGRPTRFAAYVHFSAISRRCHRINVSGVTMVAMRFNTFRLGGQAAPLVVGESQALALELLLQDPVFLGQIGDHVLLVAIQPAGEARQQYLRRVELGSHAGVRGAANPLRRGDRGSAEFSDRTGLDSWDLCRVAA